MEFQYQPDTIKTGLTANAVLPLYLDLAFRSGLVESLRRHLEVRRGGQGWADEQVVLALMLMNLAKVTGSHKIPTYASLNTIMVDGTGMCGACRVTVGARPSSSEWAARGSTNPILWPQLLAHKNFLPRPSQSPSAGQTQLTVFHP